MLPKQISPIYTLTVPSTGTKVKFRPYVVKEEKALLLAQQSEEPEVMLDTLKQVIQSCCQKIDVDSLAIFDIEYIFTQIRAKSSGEEVELFLRCQHCSDEKAKVNIKFDLTKLKVEKSDNHNKKIMLYDNVGIMMKYPTISTSKEVKYTDDVTFMIDYIISCIDYIFDENEIYHAKDQSKEELIDYIESLTSDQFLKIKDFFDTMPVIRQIFDYKCPVCGADNHLELDGIDYFF